jgi:hypothetical protein
MRKIYLSQHDITKVASILTDLDVMDMDAIVEAIAQAMELEQGHDRPQAYSIARKAVAKPELFVQ